VALAGLGCVASVATASPVVFFDGIFNDPDWTLTHFANASAVGSSQQGLQIPAGGNPNEYRRVRNNLLVSSGVGASSGVHLKPTATYNPSVSGAITLINYSEDSNKFDQNAGNGQGSGLAIFQGGRYYIQRTPILVMPTNNTWVANSAPGLVATDLWEIDSSHNLISTSNPDFSASGGVMTLGFWRGNSNFGTINTDCGIDNWRVEIVPAPGAAGLLGLAGIVGARRRRR
jgi:hypothetical protein